MRNPCSIGVRRAVRVYVSLLCVVLLLPVAWAAVTATHPYGGVTQVVRTETSPRTMRINVMQIDLTNPGIRFLVTNGNADQPSNSAIRETTAAKTLECLTAQNGQIAINAHFFQPNSTDANRWVVGLAASNGNIYSAFEGPRPATAIPAGSLTLTQTYAIMTNAPALNIDAQNNARIVHYNAAFPDRKHVLEAVTLHNAVSGSAQIVTDGVTTIPAYTQNDATGLTDGNGWSGANSWYNAVRARTAVGLSQDNRTLTLLTVDEAGGSSGMTVGEVADMLRSDYAVWNALNLDGGGSTSMAMQDPVTKVRSLINTQSNGTAARVVATNLVVFANPEIAVDQPAGTNLTSGAASAPCGSVNLGSSSGAFTFTVKNTGASDLTGLAVSGNGANSSDFAFTSIGAATLTPGSSTSFTGTFTPGGAGARTAAIHVSSNDPDEMSFDINLTGTGVATPLQAWRILHFGSFANSGDSANLFDYDKDGVTNLDEFAFGLNPKQADPGQLPKPTLNLAGGCLEITFTQPPGVSGVTYGAESSPTLLAGSWAAVPDTGTPPQHIFRVPVGAGSSPVFMRLKVTEP